MEEKSVVKKVKYAMSKLIKEYIKQKSQKLRNKNNVFLGRNISMGSTFQYIFAKELFLNSFYKVLVDYPLCYPGKYRSGKKGKKNLYSDIVVMNKKNVLKAIIELKVDLGFLRENYKGNLKRMIEAFKRNKKMKYNKLVGFSGSEEEYIQIPKNFIKIFIIGTKINHTDRIKHFKRTVKSLGFRPLILLDNIHPNPLLNTKNFEEEIEKLKIDAIKEIENKKGEINRVFKGLF